MRTVVAAARASSSMVNSLTGGTAGGPASPVGLRAGMQKILHERYETTALAAGPFRPGTARRPSMCELTLRQRFWAIRVAGGLFAALSLQSCASAGDETAGGIAAAKAKQLETARQQARAPFSAGEIATREVRPTTLRDSGQPDTIGYLRHVDFRFDGGRRLPGQPAGAAPGPAPAGRSGLARRRVVLRAAARQRYGARDGRPHGGVVQYGGVRAGSGQRSSPAPLCFRARRQHADDARRDAPPRRVGVDRTARPGHAARSADPRVPSQ
uniref:Lipoprotein (Modular protein) n=2 Tax=Ralstonia solanacearum TaxID=305 RepID=A0A0S4W746_RALSL|nr:Putative lipoprotein (modular protein) [Ralstonia solanacearum]CUV42641.1 Putative lipoprotein (modular protein) [Ralstonia solanacearum]CUV43213.1 Putative lipoprotein (modular protein) [Ralstonia solanacearum]CUV53213.1 Putative lipoprotein (modular protein) [Ralstonia solanacearum]CUV63806.1 Putative lipoprotein (modular protein) [Ralstonia solanacearum]